MSMQRKSIMRNRYLILATLATLLTAAASAATFGRVVPIGGHASDIALDERRGVLYIANYAGGSIDVMSLADSTVGRAIAVPAYPASLALSPDGRYLVIGHYASSNGSALLQPGRDALTVIDLTNNQKRTYGLSSGPVGVAFGLDALALVVTQNDFVLFDPASGLVTSVGSVANVSSQVLPVEGPQYPPQIIGGSVTATGDGRHIFGVAGITPDTGGGSVMMRFSYNVLSKSITAQRLFTASPSLGPRVIATSRDGSYYMTGWGLFGVRSGLRSRLHGCRTPAGPVAERVRQTECRLGGDPFVEVADLCSDDPDSGERHLVHANGLPAKRHVRDCDDAWHDAGSCRQHHSS